MGTTRRRSKSYPIISTREASELLREKLLRENEGEHYRKNRLVEALGYSKASGIFNRKLSALLQYGLLEADGDADSEQGHTAELYCLPEEVLELAGSSHDSWLRYFRDVIRRPPVFQMLLDELTSLGSFPEPFHDFVVSHREMLGLTISACSDVAEVFLDSARHVGLIGEDDRLILAQPADFGLAAKTSTLGTSGIQSVSLDVPLRQGQLGRLTVELPVGELTPASFAGTKRKVLFYVESLLDHLEPEQQAEVVRLNPARGSN